MRKSTSQAETVRQPGGLATDSEPTLEETLTEDELASQTFTGRHIGVVFHPGTTDWVELALDDLGLDTFEQLWVEFFEPLVLLCALHSQRETEDTPWTTHLSRTAREPMLRISFHEVNLGGPRPGNFLLGSAKGLYAPTLGSSGTYK